MNEANSHLYTKVCLTDIEAVRSLTKGQSIPFDVDAYNKRPEESKAGEM